MFSKRRFSLERVSFGMFLIPGLWKYFEVQDWEYSRQVNVSITGEGLSEGYHYTKVISQA